MQTFVAIVDGGSLTAAADALGKALPTVVRSLATLEDALGVRLLRRTTRRMSLTAEGRAYLEDCRRILAEVEDAELSLTSQQAEPRGELRVTAPVLYGQLKVGPAVARFLRDYEKVSVDLVLLDRVVNMVEEGIDVGIRIGPLPDSSLVATRIGEVRTVIVATPRVLRRVGVPKHPRQLSERPAVRFHGLSSAPSWRFVDRGKSFSVPVAGAFSCNHAATAIEACVEGLGFGRFLSYQVEALVAQKRLRVVLEAFEPAPLPVHVVYANARLVSPGLRAFIDSMKVQLQA